MLPLKHISGQQRVAAHVFIEDGERAVCVVLYSRETSKAVDALRLEERDIEVATTEVRRWIRPRFLDRESLDELIAWVREDHETWLEVLSGGNPMTAWLGSRGRRRIPQIEA